MIKKSATLKKMNALKEFNTYLKKKLLHISMFRLPLVNVFHFSLFLILIFSLLSCQSYERKPGCHLDKMHIKGNVVKIETIVQSTMPLTEIYAKAFDPQYAISTYSGNIAIEIDNNGNIKRSEGYGIDGKKIFDAVNYIPENDGCFSPVVPIGPNAKQNIDNIKIIKSDKGDVVNVKYYDGNDLIWSQKAFYSEDGSLKSIVKEYAQFSIKLGFLNIEYKDTTTFSYLNYDHLGNWTEAEISYKGVFPKHAYTYKIKRQITYLDEDKKPKLIDELAAYNNLNMISTNATDQICLGEYGTMRIPHYMALQTKDYINDVTSILPQSMRDKMQYFFMSTYDDKDAYVSMSVSSILGDGSSGYDDLSPEELKYDEEMDKYLEEQNTSVMAQGGTYVLKWLPYQFTTISGRRALKIAYYRYGNGSPIPVYCENYTIPMDDGNMISIIFSFQSNLYNKFYKDFEKSINSISFK